MRARTNDKVLPQTNHVTSDILTYPQPYSSANKNLKIFEKDETKLLEY